MATVKTWLYDSNDNQVSPKVTWDQIVLDDESSSFKQKYLEEVGNANAAIPDASITGAKIGAKEVKTANLDDGAVTAAKISNSAVTENKIASGAITEDKVADGAITSAKLDPNISFDASTLADGAINAAKLALNAVTEEKIAKDAVHSSHIFSGAVTTAKLATGAVTEDILAATAVIENKIADNAVTTNKIAENAVTMNRLDTDVQNDINTGLLARCESTSSVTINVTANDNLKEKLLATRSACVVINLTEAEEYSLEDIICVNATHLKIKSDIDGCSIKVINDGVFNGVDLEFNRINLNVASGKSVQFNNCYVKFSKVEVNGNINFNNSYLYSDDCGFTSFEARGSLLYMTNGTRFSDPTGSAAIYSINSSISMQGAVTVTLMAAANVPMIKTFGGDINMTTSVSTPAAKYSKGYECEYTVMVIPGEVITSIQNAGANASTMSFSNNLAVSNITANAIGFTSQHEGLEATNIEDALNELYTEITGKEVTDGSITTNKLSSDFVLPIEKVSGTISADSLKSSATVPMSQVTGNLATSRLEGTITADALSTECSIPVEQITGNITAKAVTTDFKLPVGQLDGDIVADSLAASCSISASQITGDITAGALATTCSVPVGQLEGTITADAISASCEVAKSNLKDFSISLTDFADKSVVLDSTSLGNLLTVLGTALGGTVSKQWTGSAYTFTFTANSAD